MGLCFVHASGSKAGHDGCLVVAAVVSGSGFNAQKALRFGTTPEQFDARIRFEMAKYVKVIKHAGIKIE